MKSRRIHQTAVMTVTIGIVLLPVVLFQPLGFYVGDKWQGIGVLAAPLASVLLVLLITRGKPDSIIAATTVLCAAACPLLIAGGLMVLPGAATRRALGRYYAASVGNRGYAADQAFLAANADESDPMPDPPREQVREQKFLEVESRARKLELEAAEVRVASAPEDYTSIVPSVFVWLLACAAILGAATGVIGQAGASPGARRPSNER
jgi:hypothetical protein